MYLPSHSYNKVDGFFVISATACTLNSKTSRGYTKDKGINCRDNLVLFWLRYMTRTRFFYFAWPYRNISTLELLRIH